MKNVHAILLMEPYPWTQDLRDAMARYVDSVVFNSPFQGRLRVTPKAFEAIADVVPPAAK